MSESDPQAERAVILARISEALQFGHPAIAAHLRRTYADLLAEEPPGGTAERPTDPLSVIWSRADVTTPPRSV